MKVILFNLNSKESIELTNIEFLTTEFNGNYFLTIVNFVDDPRNYTYENCFVLAINN